MFLPGVEDESLAAVGAWRYSTPHQRDECAKNGKVAGKPGNLNYGPTSLPSTNPVWNQRARKQDSVDQEPVEAKILRFGS